jgi:hypothetical protein
MVAITWTYGIENHQYRYKKNPLQYPEFLATPPTYCNNWQILQPLYKNDAITPTYCIQIFVVAMTLVAVGSKSSSATKVASKQLCYMSITQRFKGLFLSEETTTQMKRHKEGKHDTKGLDIMSYPADSKSWQTLDRFDLEFASDIMSTYSNFPISHIV